MGKYKVSWIVGKDDWAFLYLAKGLIKELPEYIHTFNETEADIIVVMSPAYWSNKLKGKIVLKVDSRRGYGI
ncbi:MAG TPA: hypothetical protein PLQ41_06600 [bacterium]|nr:hypothetical protein [bacterium]